MTCRQTKAHIGVPTWSDHPESLLAYCITRLACFVISDFVTNVKG
jgi:hypothetical protein